MFKKLEEWRYRFWLWRVKPPRCAVCGTYFNLATPAYVRAVFEKEEEVCGACAACIPSYEDLVDEAEFDPQRRVSLSGNCEDSRQ